MNVLLGLLLITFIVGMGVGWFITVLFYMTSRNSNGPISLLPIFIAIGVVSMILILLFANQNTDTIQRQTVHLLSIV